MQSYDEYIHLFERVNNNIELLNSANKEAENQDLHIVTPNLANNEEILDQAYEKFMSMTKPFRRRADWITLEYFGMSNQTIYDIGKQICLKFRVPDIVMNNAVGSGDTPVLEASSNILEDIFSFNKELNKFDYLDKDLKNYRIASPDKFIKQRGGICWDFVPYEAQYFKKNFPSIKYKTYYVIWDKAPNYPTHTFLIFKYNGSWYHFESSFMKIRGLWKATNESDLISHVLKQMSNDTMKPNNTRYEVREYNALDPSIIGMNSNAFMNYMNEQKKISHTYRDPDTSVVKLSLSNLNESYTAASDNINMDDMIQRIMMNRDSLDEQGMYWENETGFILLPCHIYTNIDSLEKMWELFNLMILKHRRVSDWKCQELYGFTNQKYYEWMKAKLLAGVPVQTPTPTPVYEFSSIRRYLNKLLESNDSTRFDLAESLVNISGLIDTYDGIIAGDIISDAIDKYDGLTNNLATIDLSMNDLPMYTPDEMIDMGVNSMKQVDASDIGISPEWFNEYKEYFYNGVKSDSFIKHNIERVHKLEEMTLFSTLTEDAAINLGWNYKVPFSFSNRSLADRRIRAIMGERMNTTQIIDISDIEINEMAIENIDPNEKIKIPVFVVLIEGKRPVYSDLIRFVTGGIYSHALMSFDSSLEKMYSYGVDKYTGPKGGLIIENIDELIKKHDDVHLKVYAVYLTPEKFNKLKSNVELIEENRNKTSYSWLHIFGALFKIPLKSNQAMFCSEFVDKMLKLTDVDATKAKASSITSPNDIDRAYKKHRKIYTVFNDIIARYRANKIDKLLAKLYKSAKLYSEMNLILTESSFSSYSRSNIRNIDMLRFLNESTSTYANPNMQIIYSRLIKPALYLSEDTKIPIRSNDAISIDLIKPIDR